MRSIADIPQAAIAFWFDQEKQAPSVIDLRKLAKEIDDSLYRERLYGDEAGSNAETKEFDKFPRRVLIETRRRIVGHQARVTWRGPREQDFETFARDSSNLVEHITAELQEDSREIVSSPDYAGIPRVIDGNTLSIGETKIRLHAMDVPEMHSAAGWPSRQMMDYLVAGLSVSCRELSKDRYGRSVARCVADRATKDGEEELFDLGLHLIWLGFAVVPRAYVTDAALDRAYGHAERAAALAGRGLWSDPLFPE